VAKRIVFLPTASTESSLFQEVLVDFEWVPGMAISQARKSVTNLHDAILKQLGLENVLEISTRSLTDLGIKLSAFNLQVAVNGNQVSVETAYQSSKVFKNGGPYLDLLVGPSIAAKQDERLKSSGQLLGFEFENYSWPLRTSPNFYDFLYIRGLLQFNARRELTDFEGFTDIAFSQITLDYKDRKSYNCQARSAAIYISLLSRMKESEILMYLRNQGSIGNPSAEQMGLF
jgi:type I restriction enzyme M protein